MALIIELHPTMHQYEWFSLRPLVVHVAALVHFGTVFKHQCEEGDRSDTISFIGYYFSFGLWNDRKGLIVVI